MWPFWDKLKVSESIFIQLLRQGCLAALSECKKIHVVKRKKKKIYLSGKFHQHLENLFGTMMDFESYKSVPFGFSRWVYFCRSTKINRVIHYLPLHWQWQWLCRDYVASVKATISIYIYYHHQLCSRLFSFYFLNCLIFSAEMISWQSSSCFEQCQVQCYNLNLESFKSMHAVYQNWHAAISGVFPVNWKKKILQISCWNTSFRINIFSLYPA